MALHHSVCPFICHPLVLPHQFLRRAAVHLARAPLNAGAAFMPRLICQSVNLQVALAEGACEVQIVPP